VLAASLAGRERLAAEAGAPPAAGLGGVVAWAVAARAAVFVARSGGIREREAVVREANELAAAVLGEPVAGASVASVVARLGRA
jgi:hypothetical protein